MDIVEVNTTNLPEPTQASKAIDKLIGIILWPFAILFLLLLIIAVLIIDFVKYRIVGRPKEDAPALQIDILYKDESLTIIKEPINYAIDKLAVDFQFSLVDYDDEMEVWRLKSIPELPALQDAFVTGLYIDLEHEIILQRIVPENGQPSSELIGLNKKSKKVRIYNRVGLFYLYKFDAETNEIAGASRTEAIRIKINKAIA